MTVHKLFVPASARARVVAWLSFQRHVTAFCAVAVFRWNGRGRRNGSTPARGRGRPWSSWRW